MGCLFRRARGVGLPAPRYWASGRGVMLPASSVGTATRTQLSMALSQRARERRPWLAERGPFPTFRGGMREGKGTARRLCDCFALC